MGGSGSDELLLGLCSFVTKTNANAEKFESRVVDTFSLTLVPFLKARIYSFPVRSKKSYSEHV